MRRDVAELLRGASYPIFIWGSGEMGKMVFERLSEEGINCKGYVINDGPSDVDRMVYSKEQVIEENQEYILIRGFLKAYYMDDEEVIRMWPGCKGIYSVPDAYEPRILEELTDEFYENNKDAFQSIRGKLEDDFSKKSFDAYITAKTTKCAGPLLPYVVTPQYFFEPTPWIACGGGRKPDVLVDCGAYTGDSILDFVDRWGDGYSEIIACEPDPNNYEKLLQTIKEYDIKNVTTVPMGMYSSRTTLRFHASGEISARFDMDGETELQVDTIDNIAEHKSVSIIKMDIEGSELDALEGARKTIDRCRPILMISAYHKKDDLFRIYHLINDIVDDYKYYFRCHKPLAMDAVLYAVPVERVAGRNE